MRALTTALATSTVLLALAACAGPDAEPAVQPPGQDPNSSAPATTSTAAAPAPTGPPSLTEPTTDLLDWQPVAGPTDVSVTTNGPWTLAYDEERGRATLTGPDGPASPTGSTVGGRVSDALLDDDWAVVVHQDPQERKPAIAVVTDLATGSSTVLDGSTLGAPTVSGGTWALDGDRAAYATRGPGNAYCLAVADLRAATSSVVWCAAAKQGFNGAHLSDDGDTLQVFDDAQPSCRSVVTVDAAGVTPFDGVVPCEGFDGVITDDGDVWSDVSNPERIESATFHAHAGDATYDLGPGTSGTLTRCGDAAYFVRDPQATTEPARLMRWREGELSVVFESASGQAFLAAPRCAGDVLTVSSFAEGGDDQVSAVVTG